MAIVKFIDTQDSKLDLIPIKQGQFIFCYDSGNCFKDTHTTRQKIGADIIILDDGNELPLTPIKNKLYILNRNLYMYIPSVNDWISLTNVGLGLADDDSFEPLGG